MNERNFPAFLFALLVWVSIFACIGIKCYRIVTDPQSPMNTTVKSFDEVMDGSN